MQLPKALPDESIFSRICRYLALSGLVRSQSLKFLLGDARAAVHPYLTSNLSMISLYTGETVRELWLNQTLLPLFAFYLPRYQSVIRDTTINSAELIRACQLSTFRERERLSAKYCSLCAIEDIQTFGVAYWHCSHQIPGMETCSKHRVWLVHRELPNRIHLASDFLPLPCEQSEKCNRRATEFARYAEQILELIRVDSKGVNVRDEYNLRLREKGLLTQSGRVRRKALAQELFIAANRILPSSSHLSLSSSEDFGYFSALLSGDFNQHPFKHLLLDFCLEQYQAHHNSMRTQVSSQAYDMEECCHLLREGVSMARVSRKIGKSRCYVKSVALKHNIQVNLKPKVISSKLKQEVIHLARKGFNRIAIARKYDISTGSVELIISTTDGLVERRKQCKSQSMFRRYKVQIIRYVLSHNEASRQEVRQACDAAFTWLYQHHRHWLEGHLPPAQKTKHVDRVDWKERDKELAIKISSLLENAARKLTRSELDKLLGGHGWLISKKKNLPLTLAVIRSSEKIKLK